MHPFVIRASAAVLVAMSLCAPADARQIVIERTETSEPLMMPGTPMRGQVKTGTGRIAGRVLSADTATPLRRAQVRINAPEIGVKTALTDAEGRYEFRDLPAGRFTVTASKSGYVSVQYGQSRPFESGRPLELADKQMLDKADIVMPRGGVISGRIVDEFGDPVPDATVTSLRQAWSGGRRRLQATGRVAQTNDLGQFRLYGLPPGEYYVSATLRNTDMLVLETALAARGESGASGSQPSSGYAPTYFPGTTTPASAQRVVVSVGQEAQNTDFALAPVRLARIAGVVIGSDGKPLEGAMVSAMPSNSGAQAGTLAIGLGNTARTAADGAFTITGVAPGDYTLNVRTVRVITSDGGNTVMFRAVIGGDGGDSESASMPVVVSGEDLGNVVIMTSKGGSAVGRLTFEGGSGPPPSQARVSAVAPDADGPAMGGAATVKADGTFELTGLAGRRLIRVSNLPVGWSVKAVRLNGDDITDAGADFAAGQEASGLEIVVTNKTTEISGAVTAASGSPVKDYTVIVFSEDPQQWNLPLTRWVAGARPDQEGRFRVRNMPPGAYYAVAVDYVEQGSWGDPELLERLRGRARRFTLREGATETLDLKLADGI